VARNLIRCHILYTESLTDTYVSKCPTKKCTLTITRQGISSNVDGKDRVRCAPFNTVNELFIVDQEVNRCFNEVTSYFR